MSELIKGKDFVYYLALIMGHIRGFKMQISFVLYNIDGTQKGWLLKILSTKRTIGVGKKK